MKRQTRNVGLFILAATMSLSGTTASFAESMPDKMEAETSVAVTAEAENETANGNTMHWTVVQAETEHDTPALSGSDSDNLYDSMLTLADKIEDLTTETKSLRGQNEEVQQKYEEEKEEELETEEETEEEQTGDPMDENKFLRKIKKSLKKRTEAAISYSESELGAMTNDELVEANAKCCEEEESSTKSTGTPCSKTRTSVSLRSVYCRPEKPVRRVRLLEGKRKHQPLQRALGCWIRKKSMCRMRTGGAV